MPFESGGVEDVWFSWGGDSRGGSWIGAMCAFWSELLDDWPGGRGFSKGTVNDEGLGDNIKVLSTLTSVSSGIGFASILSGGWVAGCTAPLESCS